MQRWEYCTVHIITYEGRSPRARIEYSEGDPESIKGEAAEFSNLFKRLGHEGWEAYSAQFRGLPALLNSEGETVGQGGVVSTHMFKRSLLQDNETEEKILSTLSGIEQLLAQKDGSESEAMHNPHIQKYP